MKLVFKSLLKQQINNTKRTITTKDNNYKRQDKQIGVHVHASLEKGISFSL